jgi:hypothetical protein
LDREARDLGVVLLEEVGRAKRRQKAHRCGRRGCRRGARPARALERVGHLVRVVEACGGAATKGAKFSSAMGGMMAAMASLVGHIIYGGLLGVIASAPEPQVAHA